MFLHKSLSLSHSIHTCVYIYIYTHTLPWPAYAGSYHAAEPGVSEKNNRKNNKQPNSPAKPATAANVTGLVCVCIYTYIYIYIYTCNYRHGSFPIGLMHACGTAPAT